MKTVIAVKTKLEAHTDPQLVMSIVRKVELDDNDKVICKYALSQADGWILVQEGTKYLEESLFYYTLTEDWNTVFASRGHQVAKITLPIKPRLSELRHKLP